MNISEPKSKYGQEVLVLNYRCKPAQWVYGECRAVAYKSNFGERFSWVYDVYVPVGKGYFIYVGDKQIKQAH